jgi:hypothetical protein
MAKWQIGKMANWQNCEMTKWEYLLDSICTLFSENPLASARLKLDGKLAKIAKCQMANWENGKMANWQNGKLAKWQIGKISI